jgi:hypothetical protein
MSAGARYWALTALSAAGFAAGAKEPLRRPWLQTAPERMPVLTVRWEDAGQKDVFVVEGGEYYQVRVSTHPVHILSLRAPDWWSSVAGAVACAPCRSRSPICRAGWTRWR